MSSIPRFLNITLNTPGSVEFATLIWILPILSDVPQLLKDESEVLGDIIGEWEANTPAMMDRVLGVVRTAFKVNAEPIPKLTLMRL